MEEHERTVLGAARGVLGELDVEVVLDRVVAAARELTGAEYAALGVLEERPEGGAASAENRQIGLARFITVGIDEQTRHQIGDPPHGLGVLGELIRNPTPLRLANVSAHPHSYGFPVEHPQMRAFLGVPVFVGGRPFGNLYLTEKADGEQFTQQDEDTVVTLAELAGVAIENAQRYTGAHQRREELERTVAALQATTEVTRAIGDETNLDTVLTLVAKRGRALVSARVLVIELVQGEELLIAAGAGELSEGLIGQRIPIEGSFTEQAIRVRGAVRIEDELSRARFNEVGVGRLGIKAHAGLAVPLLFREHAFGALIALDPLKGRTMFSPEDARLLEAFATSAATAVAVARTVAADIERLASVVRSSPDAIITTDKHGTITSWNPGAEEVYGYTAAEMVGRAGSETAELVVPEGSNEELDILPHVLAGEVVKHYETVRLRKDGSRAEISLSVAPIHDPYGKIAGVASVARDLTEHKQTQRILSQTERLESIGQLAGGVAHDMNNLLTIILNHSDFALASLPDDSPIGEDLRQARGATERAVTLVRQLLQFARQEPASAETLDVNKTISGLAGMMRRTLGEHIDLQIELSAEPCLIEADPGGVEQVVLNLAVNARDAMPDGGTLTITTANVVLDEDRLNTYTGRGEPGKYACLAVSDTGTGMTPEVIARALEPFYTTKPAGSGTGLGLATVYGILGKRGGLLHISSEPEQGTTIATYWPVAQAASYAQDIAPDSTSDGEPADASPEAERVGRSRAAQGETILLVEDEQSLNALASRILTEHGYTVLAASRPSEAKDLTERHGGDIELLITDVVMPETGGMRLAEQLRARCTSLPVLYTSGYVPNASELPAGAAFLAKPFSREQLLAAVSGVLENEPTKRATHSKLTTPGQQTASATG